MDDSSPSTPAAQSRAPPGVIASTPDEITNVTVADGDGYLIRWEGAEWFYAHGDAFVSLDDRL